mmetsp:Transcript_54947/g.107482  ORF Transcript_54947/g.107482 Transcript_54947/m.107482 type:complete len:92 (-) Transcript_54947:220-495(-)
MRTFSAGTWNATLKLGRCCTCRPVGFMRFIRDLLRIQSDLSALLPRPRPRHLQQERAERDKTSGKKNRKRYAREERANRQRRRDSEEYTWR